MAFGTRRLLTNSSFVTCAALANAESTALLSPSALRRGEIRAGVDGQHAGRLARFFDVYFFQHGVRVRRAHESGMRLPGEGYVIGVLAGAGEKTIVVSPRAARADQ